MLIFNTVEGASADSRSWTVLVSIAPHKYFVERIAGETVKTQILIPAGSNAHTFEPTPKQVLSASQADLWFRIGEPFEQQTLAALQSHNTRLKPVNLSDTIELITSGHHCTNHNCKGADLHYWLSAKQAKFQAKAIAEGLTKQYPENAKRYGEALEEFLKELDELDRNIATELNHLTNRTIMVSHPAYAYFCRDYGLSQISVEFEGKDPSPQQLTKILQKAKEQEIKTVFIQPQFSNKGAKLVAEQLNAKVVSIDPFMENYPQLMMDISQKISNK